MKTLSIAQVKANFSGLARQVERGATVLVTRRGKAIIEIRPAVTRTADEATQSIKDFRRDDGFNRSAALYEAGESPRSYAHRGHRR